MWKTTFWPCKMAHPGHSPCRLSSLRDVAKAPTFLLFIFLSRIRHFSLWQCLGGRGGSSLFSSLSLMWVSGPQSMGDQCGFVTPTLQWVSRDNVHPGDDRMVAAYGTGLPVQFIKMISLRWPDPWFCHVQYSNWGGGRKNSHLVRLPSKHHGSHLGIFNSSNKKILENLVLHGVQAGNGCWVEGIMSGWPGEPGRGGALWPWTGARMLLPGRLECTKAINQAGNSNHWVCSEDLLPSGLHFLTHHSL